jgi:hypothetical protein
MAGQDGAGSGVEREAETDKIRMSGKELEGGASFRSSTMSEAGRRGATSAASGNPPLEAPSVVPNHLPFGRAASIIAVVVLAGALFGYDQGVISGALIGIQKAFDVGHVALEIVTSWVTLGAMFGSIAGGFVADHFGRKRALLVAAGLFIIGALIQSFAPNVPILVFGRLVAGFGVGVAAVYASAEGRLAKAGRAAIVR